MTIDLEKARKIIALENEVRDALSTMNRAAREISTLEPGLSVKLSSWSWGSPGTFADVSIQGNTTFKLEERK